MKIFFQIAFCSLTGYWVISERGREKNVIGKHSDETQETQ